MNCLRCGRETQDDHVFCDQCLKTMEKYPVRPGTAVILPQKKEAIPAKKQKRHLAPNPDDQIRKLRHQKRILIWTVVILAAVLIGFAALAGHLFRTANLRPGQNYSAVETTV